MSEDYLHLYLAEEIMNWERKEFPFSEENWNPVNFWVNEKGEKMHRVHEWNPVMNLEHAFEIVKYLKTKGYYLHLTQTDELGMGMKVVEEDVWQCTFLDEQRNAYTEYDEDEKLAICLAAIKVVRETKEQKDETSQTSL
jgi:hypothetical protein